MTRILTQKALLAVTDKKLCSSLESALQEAGVETFLAHDSQDTIRLAKKEKPEFILIDRMLPKIGGIRLCRNIRLEKDLAETQIIIISDQQDFSDRIRTLDAGADDYLVKPYQHCQHHAQVRISGEPRAANGYCVCFSFHGEISSSDLSLLSLRRGQVKVMPSSITLRETFSTLPPINSTRCK